MLGRSRASSVSEDRRGPLEHFNWSTLEELDLRFGKQKAILREETCFSFPVRELELYLDVSDFGGRTRG